MAKKKKKSNKKPNKSKKKVKREYIPRKTIVNVPDKPIDPAKIEREKKRKNKERQMKRLMEKMNQPYAPATKVSKVMTTKIHPIVSRVGGDVVIKIKKDFGAKIPGYAYPEDAGLDIYSNEERILPPMHRAPIKTGLYFELPKGYVGLVWDKSGLSLRNGIHAMAGVLDSGYRGELKIVLINLSSKTMKIERGVKIAQLLIQRVEKAVIQESDSLEDSERGGGGFGSSGLKEIERIKEEIRELEEEDDEDIEEDNDEDDEEPILESFKEKSKKIVKLDKEKPHLKDDIKKAIRGDNQLF